ncbi:unnamed protein product [Darwinula stevensoni]|uniref:Septin-type G domain-containing protein n=1 Tax=Darwinula stevensoni TaxID=69355 RepID=A0A7R8XDM5_9CRUS|nr:unnamed protein product [Darwinula stevensoni]CAG0894927.1 unnamed protein product [Darwinula stevensoni]
MFGAPPGPLRLVAMLCPSQAWSLYSSQVLLRPSGLVFVVLIADHQGGTNVKIKKKELCLAEGSKQLLQRVDGHIREISPRSAKEEVNYRLRKYDIGNKVPDDREGKVLMLVGATGSGKSTFVNGLVNYAYGVKWEDDFRYKLVVNEENENFEAHSQTNWISAYVLHKQEGISLPYTLTVIDTPGFGDSEGKKKDEELLKQIREFLSHGEYFGLEKLSGIGFVVPAPEGRLTDSQKYIFHCMLSVFGKNFEDRIFAFATFADNLRPPVLNALVDAKVPFKKIFKFNNSVLFTLSRDDDTSDLDRLAWKMGIQSFTEFFEELKKTKPVSLQEVLQNMESIRKPHDSQTSG